jgi:hypothetical protein
MNIVLVLALVSRPQVFYNQGGVWDQTVSNPLGFKTSERRMIILVILVILVQKSVIGLIWCYIRYITQLNDV